MFVLIGVEVRVGCVPVAVTVGDKTVVLERVAVIVGVKVFVDVRVGVTETAEVAVGVPVTVDVGVDTPGLHANSTSSQIIVESVGLALYEMIR